MADGTSFGEQLRAAVGRAQDYLGPGFNLTDKRANAYLEIASVLRDEYQRTNNINLLNAAHQLEEQAEITTYSGFNGRAALIGNYAAMVNNPTLYNVPLDVFSWQIDKAVINFFEAVANNERFSEITAQNINAVDGLVWASKGMLESFPGTALGIDYRTIPNESSVWKALPVTSEQQAQLRLGSYGQVTYVAPWGNGGGLGVATTFLSPLAQYLGREPISFKISQAAIDDYLDLPANSRPPVRSDDGRYYYSVDQYGRETIREAANGVYDPNGAIAWVKNDNQLGGWDGVFKGILESAALGGAPVFLLDFVDIAAGPSGQSSYTYKMVDGVWGPDAIQERLGANFGPDGLRYYNQQNSSYYVEGKTTDISEKQLFAQFYASRRVALSSIPLIAIDQDGTRTIGIPISVKEGEAVVTYMQSGIVNGQGQFVAGAIKKVIVDSSGAVTGLIDVTLAEQDRVATALANQNELRLLAREQIDRMEAASQPLANSAHPDEKDGLAIHQTTRVDLAGGLEENGSQIVIRSNWQPSEISMLDPNTGLALPKGFLAYGRNGKWEVRDDKYRSAKITYGADGKIQKTEIVDGFAESDIIISGSPMTPGKTGRVNVVTTYENGKPVSTDIKLNNNPIGIEFSDFGSVLGQQLGYRLAGGNQLAGIVTSAALKTLGDNLGDVLDGIIGHQSTTNATNDAFATTGAEFLSNLKSAGIGAISSFLTAELINVLDLDGLSGELADTAAGAAIGQIASNLASLAAGGKFAADGVSQLKVFSDVNPTMVLTAVGSFLGTKLASEIVSFDTIGGQIGSSVGASLGAIGAVALVTGGGSLASTFSALGIAAGPVGALVGAFVGFIVGGLIGSVFGGIPRSGADAQWSEDEGRFVVANVWSKKGGSKDAARSVASAVSETFNSILSATGGALLDPTSVQSGNYGMRGKKFVYKPYSTKSSDAITQRFSGKDAATRLIGYGVYTGLTDPDFKIAGGDVYVKRALYNTFEMGGLNALDFDSSVLLGNIASAQQYESYLANSTVINALVAAEPDSVFAAETMINLARAVELGLTRRHASDWYGGFSYLIQEAQTNAVSVDFGFDYDPYSGQISRLIGIGDYVLGDAIDIAGQTTIEAGAANDVIDLRGKKLADQSGYTVNGELQDDIAASGADFTATNATVSFATGELRKQVTVAVAGDTDTAIESFLAALSNGTGVSAIGGDATATIISDASSAAHLMVGRSFASEADGYAVFRLSLSKAVGTDVTVSLALAGGRATGQGIDYGATDTSNLQVSIDGINWTNATSATFAAGTTQLFVRTAVIADNVLNPEYVGPTTNPLTGQVTPGNGKPQYLNVEGNESFTLTATVTAGAGALANGATPISGKGTIIDATSGSKPYVWLDNVVVHEDSGTATFTISRSRSTNEVASITFSTADRRELAIDVAATVDGGAGNDTIYASDLGDNIFGGTGNDTLYGGRLDDWLLGGDGDDVLEAGTADQNALGGDGNYLNGGAGNDLLRGREGSDWLEGGEGADTLTAGAGDDILAGGAGDGDILKGGLDNDQYLVRLGDGADIAEDEPNGAPAAQAGGGDYVSQRMAGLLAGTIKKNWIGDAPGVVQKAAIGGEDAIVFGAGISLNDIQMIRSSTDSDDLIIRVMQTNASGVTTFTGTQLTVKDWFADYFKRIEWLKFADGSEIRIGDITSFIVGGSGNDVLIGTSGNDFVYGGDGDDQLQLLGGDDIGNGGTGNDLVAGHSGQDLLVGGLGVDQLIGGKGKDALSGDGGGDDLYGGDDNDILSGGRGDGDVVVGGAGDDIFKYSRGDGRDELFDDYSAHWDVVWSASGQWNEAAGYHYDEQTGEVTGPGGAYLRKNVGTAQAPNLQWLGRFDYDDVTGTLTVFNPPAGSAVVANSGTDTIEFDPGIKIQDIVLSRPAGSNDLIFNIADENSEFSTANSIGDSITIKDWYALPGQIEKLAFYQTGILDIRAGVTNLIAGTDYADGTDITPLAGTSGADWITGGAGDDVIAGGSGNDIIAGNSGFDTLKGEMGDDVLYGGAGNDILDGGKGNDVLIGGAGQDTASYVSASGWVRAVLSASWSNAGEGAGDSYDSIEDLTGGAAADILGGDEDDNVLTGGQGNDTLRGGVGDDTYVWNIGDGADNIKDAAFSIEEAVTSAGQLADGYSVKSWATTGAIEPVSGYRYWRLQVQDSNGTLVYDSSSYVYAPGVTPAAPIPSAYIQAGWLGGFSRTNGQQVTRFAYDSSVSGGEDVLEFGQGIGLGDLKFTRTGNDLLIQYNGSSTAQLILYDQFTANGAIETLQFADGLSASLSSIMWATSSAQVAGTSGDDLILGQWGSLADNLAGGDGNDVLVGYDGNDLLYGGNGDDILEGGAGADRLDGGTNSAATEIGWGDSARYARSAAGVQVNLVTGTGSGGDAEGDLLIGIENVTGSQFADTLTGDAGGNRLSGLGGNDVINGGDGANVLDGGDGDDFINGGKDDDNIDGGDGNDVIYALDGNDLVQAGLGNDQVYGGTGNDQILGDGGDDHLEGNWGNDQLQGGDGADVLVGGDGNDTLAGGTGTDWLQGDAGDDVYLFDARSGSDTIADGSGINSIVFDQGVGIDDIWLTRQGDDLKIGVIGGDATITVSNYFSTTNPSRIRTISTATHSLFLKYATPLIGGMSASSASTPASMPAAIATQLVTYWHEGHKAKPTGNAIAIAINEDNASGPVAAGAVDHDENISGYLLGTGPANGSATVDGLSGFLVYTPNADFNGADSFTVIVTDADGQSAEIAVKVSIAAVNDAPRDIRTADGTSISVMEGATGSPTGVDSPVKQLAATEVEGEAMTFSLVNDAGGRFALTNDGLLIAQNPALLDHEAAMSHTIRVRVADVHGAWTEKDFTVTVGNWNEANSLPAAHAMAVDENVAIGTLVGTVTASDPDGAGDIFGQQRYYFWNGSAASAVSSDGRYMIDALSGQIKTNAALDYEADNASVAYTVIARDNAGQAGYNQTASMVTIGIANRNEANSLPATQAMAIDENVAIGTPVGTIAATDLDSAGDVFGQQRYFFLSGGAISDISSDGRYRIDAVSGLISTHAALDYEAGNTSVSYTVIARDNQGAAGYNQASSTVTIAVNNVNEVPDTPILSDARGIVGEALSGGLANSWVARFTLSDVDGPTPTLRLVSNPSNRFKVVGNEVHFADGFEPDFETLYNSGLTASDSDGDGQMEVLLTGTVDATDGSLSSPGSTDFAIRVEDVNEAPTALNWSASLASVAERDRVANGTMLPATTIGTLSVTDPDIAGFADASYSYSVSDSRFEVVGNVLRLKQGAALDYEAGSSIAFTMTATDLSAAPHSIQRTITLAVDNQDDVLEGDANANSLIGQQNRDLLYGFGGNDTIDGGDGDDLIDGGSGDDLLIGNNGHDTVYGGDGADTIRAGAGNDSIYGGANDVGTFDTLFGEDGDDILNGDDGDDVLFGGLGSDQLIGGAGSDWADYSQLRSGVADTMGVTADLVTPASNTGAAAGDSYSSVENLRGTGIADTLSGDGSVNRIEGLGGNDILRGRSGDDNLQGGSGNDTLYGDDGADTLLGDDGDDIIYGGTGNDTLLGGAGNDQLYAESGDDYLDGGAGNDLLNGGVDNDTYIVTRSSEADTIYNYDPSGDDVDVLGFQDTAGSINDEDLWFEQVGNDMRISVIGTTSSVLIKDWYLISDPSSRSNYKIDFIIAGERYSTQINVEGLVQLMATKTKPTTTAQRDILMADLTYKAQWATYWGTNAKPVMSAIGNRTVNEDGTINLTVTATDDITPNANIQMSATVISGSSVIANAGLVFGAPDSSDQRSFTITPVSNASGTATIRVQATDAGGVTETQEFTVTVNAIADTPVVAAFTGGSGTSGQAGGIPLTLDVTFPDTDGSETQEIWISGVPSGVTLSAGTYDSAAGIWKLTSAQTSGLKVNAPAGWSQDLSLSVTARATEAGQTAISAVKTTTVVINAPPTGANLSGSINENAANNTMVGTITGVDPDAGDVLAYTLIDNAGGRFALSSAGVLSVANGSLLNYEAATSHAITVRVTDSFGQTKDQALTVAVNNINEANSLPGSYGMAVNENMAVGTLVGTVTASDPDSSAIAFGQQRYYFWNGSATSSTSSDGRYAINATTGQITTNAALNYEAGNTNVAYTVIARDNAGAAGYNQTSSTVTIGVVDLNEANSLPASYGMAVNENVAIGTLVGTVAASDPDGSGVAFGQQRYYFWNGSAASGTSSDGRYTIDAVTGQIKTNAALNYEAGNTSVAYTVIARDNQGAAGYTQSSTTVTVGINNLNEANSLPAGYTMAVNENVGVGTLVGTVTATDVDSSGVAFGQQRYYFWNGSVASNTSFDGRYVIDAVTGLIKTNSALNYEAGNALVNYTVLARDNQGNAGYNQTSTTVTIGINNVNEANSLAGFTMYVSENVGVGTTVGTVAASDPDGSGVAFGQQRYWFWDGTNYSNQSWDGRYVIDNVTGIIRTNAPLNREAPDPGRNYVIRARDNQGNPGYTEAAANFWIEIANVNETPNAPDNGATKWSFFDETGLGSNPANAYVVTGSFGLSDPDGGTPSLRFADGSTSQGWFYIDGNTVRFQPGLNFDFEWFRANGYNIYDWNGDGRLDARVADVSLKAFDGSAWSSPTLMQVFISDVNEQHTLANRSFNVNESNTALGPWTGVTATSGELLNAKSLMLSDAEGGANISYRFSNGSQNWGPWSIDAATGAIWMTGGTDYESLVEVYQTQGYWDEYGGYYEYQVYTGRDTSRATFNLGVQAIDNSSGQIASATLTLNVADVNEDVSYASYLTGSSKGTWIKRTDTEYWIMANSSAVTRYITPIVTDPERQGVTYSISNLSYREYNVVSGGSGEINATAMPNINIDSSGRISFWVPGQDWDGEWEGGLKIGGVRRTSSVDATFTLNIVNGDRTTYIPMKITFIRRGQTTPPVMLDLDGDGLELVAADISTTTFDMDLDGIADRTGWLSGDDGFLALDRNANGTIDDIKEISFVEDAEGAVSDLEGLRAYDSNANGFLDGGDERFAEFQIWRDVNQDGVSQTGELFSLSALGIAQVNLTLNLTGEVPGGADNVIYATSEFLRDDGTSGAVGDVFLSFDPSDIGIAAPVILDYDGDGAGLISVTSSTVRFDMDGDGATERTGWIEAGDAFLALDRNGDGKISDIAEISFVGDLEGAKTDLEGLKAFDSNGDGVLDALDARFAEFKLWFDTNSNSISDAGEVKSLAEAGISAIGLLSVAPENANDGGNIIYGKASFSRTNGTTGTALDAGLAYVRGDGSAREAYSAWTGTETPATSDAPIVPAIDVERQEYERKSKRYMISTTGGQMFVRRRSDTAVLDGRSGLIDPATILSFSNKDIGMLSPIILDLDGDGVEMRSIKKAKAAFDMNGDGIADNTGWVGKGDGFLVIDRDGDGSITSASELSFLTEKSNAKSDLDALGALDSNKDGKIDANDTRFGELKVWVDGDGDGATDSGELKSLADHGITSISLSSRAVEQNVKIGSNVVLATSTFTRANGSVGTVGDVALAYKPGEAANEPASGWETILARMTQQMAAFGAESGEGELNTRYAKTEALYDYFAA
ncbi:cadherin domain-containing protein [Sphingobium sp. LMC3-1-1.1]|uniref:cadherin domain-containing protein n=1 Tax=unclassified Sphingobium TaxID=2611147 RepID=UPI0034482C55